MHTVNYHETSFPDTCASSGSTIKRNRMVYPELTNWEAFISCHPILFTQTTFTANYKWRNEVMSRVNAWAQAWRVKALILMWVCFPDVSHFNAIYTTPNAYHPLNKQRNNDRNKAEFLVVNGKIHCRVLWQFRRTRKLIVKSWIHQRGPTLTHEICETWASFFRNVSITQIAQQKCPLLLHG